MESKNYRVFRDESDKGFDLNIVGVRTADMGTNTFNDRQYVFWRMEDDWQRLAFDCTTDPGLYWLRQPMNVKGTAIVAPGQYRGLWHIGLHRGQYQALTQKKPVTVYRDANRDDYLNMDANTETGLFGINLHRASKYRRSTQVDRWSAGCQVIADPLDFDLVMETCRMGRETYGNSFTYTLLTEDDLPTGRIR